MRISHPTTSPARSAFTLLEVILTTAIAVLLLAALYVAFNIQMGNAQAGRDLVERTTLARVLHNRIRNDVNATLTLCDPSRFRAAAAAAESQGGATGGTGTDGSTDPADEDPDAAEGGDIGTVYPWGIQGDSQQLLLYTSRVPGEYFRLKPDEAPPIVSDQRRILYWLLPEGGLARIEYKTLTSSSLDDLLIPEDEENHVVAREVKELSFEYFDGTTWVESWDSSTLGADQTTPVGPPRAIAVTLGIARPPGEFSNEPLVKYYRHVIAIPTADGLPLTEVGGLPLP